MTSGFTFSSRISSTGEDEGTAAYEMELCCLAGASVVTVSETEQGGEREEGEGIEETVVSALGDRGAAQREAQLLFFAPSAIGRPVVGEDNAA